MHDITRRSFVISAAAAGAAFGLNGPLEIFSSAAQAQGSNPIGAPQALIDQGFTKFKIGSIEVIQIYDGHWEKAHAENFIRNASLDETKAALKKAGVPAELHIYAAGGHGFGLRPSEHPCSTWPRRCEEWLRTSKLLEPKP